MGWLAYIMYFLSHFRGWTLGKSFETLFYLLSLFVIIPMWNTSNKYQNNKNSDTVYRLQARAKTPHFEGKTYKSLLFL